MNIHKAAERGDVPALKRQLSMGSTLFGRILHLGASVSTQNKEGKSPLHCAAARGKKDAINFLITQGADIAATDEWGGSVLHGADADVVDLLVNTGTDIEAKNKKGDTPLNDAVGSLQLPLTKALIAHGAQVNTEDNSGRTPLDKILHPDHFTRACLLFRGTVGLSKSTGASLTGLMDDVRNLNANMAIATAAGHGVLEKIEALLVKAGRDEGSEHQCERRLLNDAQRGASLGSEVDQLVTELIRIGEQDGYLSLKPGGRFNEDNRHIRAREIARILHEQGGMNLMKAALFRVLVARGSASETDAGRSGDLEIAWHGVGDWLG